MDSYQSPTPKAPVKKILVKRVKVLVKRPVAAAPAATPAPTPAPAAPTMVKVPVQRPVAPATPSFAQAVQRLSATQTPVEQPKVSRSGRRSYLGQVINGIEVKPVVFELPDDILAAVEKYNRIPQKAMALYIYARTYAERVAEEEGYEFPPMLIELPEDTMQMREIIDEIDDGGEFFDAILDDMIELAPFIDGMERIVKTKAPLERLIQSELQRLQGREISTPEQIILAYLNLLVDMLMVHEKLEMQDTEDEMEEIVEDIKDMDEEESDLKERFIAAIERKRFPVDAKKLITNYFNLARKDPDKAYETLITNPLFFSPIQLERMPRKFFGLVKPSAKDAIAVNKQLASFLKHLKA